MPRYYFHFRSAQDIAKDDQGTDLPDLEAAHAAALASARELVADAIKAGYDDIPESILITDEVGKELASVPLKKVVPSRLRD